jgi:hypothetical protein
MTTQTRNRKADVVFGRDKALRLAKLASTDGLAKVTVGIERALADLPAEGAGFTWRQEGEKILSFLRGERGVPFTLFIPKGNTKLPFFTWSTLSLFTCPGKGECASWCYTLTGWRHASAFWRQVQNTILLRFMPEVVADAFFDLPKDITMRLYVDGDFSSRSDVAFWFKLLRLRSDIQAYGYSKSWDELVGHEKVPDNYVLNLSGGGRERQVSKATMLTLPMVRGEYIAVSVPQRFISMRGARYDNREYHDHVREAARALGHTKVFSCPGKCGECVKGKDGAWTHACGDMRFKGVVIANGIH